MTIIDAPAPLRENLGPFVPLRGDDVEAMLNEPELRARYLEALGYMHDVVCELSDQPIHARFPNLDDLRIDMEVLIRRQFDADDHLSQHVRENWDTALTLREDYFLKRQSAEEGIVRSEIAGFLSGLLFAYNQVRALR